MTEKVKLAELVKDFNLYPRSMIDGQHVRDMVRSLQAGHILPPIVVDRASKRIVDGWHRHSAYVRFLGDGGEVDVDLQDYVDEDAIFLDAVTRNAEHGKKFSSHDRARCVALAEARGIDYGRMADVLHVKVEVVKEIHTTKVAYVTITEEPIALKRPMRVWAGTTITDEQVEANRRSGGMTPLFCANQLILFLGADVVDCNHEPTIAGLRILQGKLAEFLTSVEG